MKTQELAKEKERGLTERITERVRELVEDKESENTLESDRDRVSERLGDRVTVTGYSSDVSSLEGQARGLPGDSFPGVRAENSLEGIDSESESESDYQEQEDSGVKSSSLSESNSSRARLLSRLVKGGDRMEQIKRQLVVQRGAIVAALKMVADNRTQAHSLRSEQDTEHTSQRDRDSGSIYLQVWMYIMSIHKEH